MFVDIEKAAFTVVVSLSIITLFNIAYGEATAVSTDEDNNRWSLMVQANDRFKFIYDPNTRSVIVRGDCNELTIHNSFAAIPRLVGEFFFVYDFASHPDQDPIKIWNLRTNQKFAGRFPVDLEGYFPHPTAGFYRLGENWAIQGFARFDGEAGKWKHKYFLIIPADDGIRFAQVFQHGERGVWAYMAEGRLAFRSLNTDQLIMVMVPPEQEFKKLMIPLKSW